MVENATSKYEIILNLKELNKQLLECTNYNQVDKCRYQLLSFIENTSVLKIIYQDIISKEDTLKRDGEFNNYINKIHSYVIDMLNILTRYRTFTLSRQKVLYLNNVEEVTMIENNMSVGQFVECPSLIYYPSLTLLLPPKNYLDLQIKNQLITNLSDLYSLFENGDNILHPFFLIMTIKYNLEYFILNKDSFNIGQQENNFNAAYLRCIVYSVNESLQAHLQNNKPDIITEIRSSNTAMPQADTQNFKCQLTNEEIQILKLRKTLFPNKYKNIGESLTPKLTENHVNQKFQTIKNKLGASSPDEAVSIFEQTYYSLANN